MNWILAHISDIFAVFTAGVTFASLIANLTPTDSDNKIVAAIGGIVHTLALNFNPKA